MSQSRVQGVREFPNSQNQQVRQDLDYKAPQRSLSLRMPLFNYEAISRYRQSLAQYDQADEVFKLRGNDLLDRLGTAYLQRLLAEENVRLSKAQVAAVEAQRERARRLMEKGEATRIEVAEGDAALDVAKVQLIAPKAGRRKFQGVLRGLKDGQVVLETVDAGTVELKLDEIERARLVPDYEMELSGS